MEYSNHHFEPLKLPRYMSTPSGFVREGDGPQSNRTSIVIQPEVLPSMEFGLLVDSEDSTELNQAARLLDEQCPPTPEQLIER